MKEQAAAIDEPDAARNHRRLMVLAAFDVGTDPQLVICAEHPGLVAIENTLRCDAVERQSANLLHVPWKRP